MKPRLTRYAVGTVGVLLLASAGTFLAGKHALHNYRHFIESQYRTELSLIEKEMRVGKNVYLKDAVLDSFEIHDRVRHKIGEALSATEFFDASWSSDGHHGLESLKQMPTGYSQFPLIGSADARQSHALYFGHAEDGTKLLIYVGWVPSEWKREYRIAFRRSEIRSKIKGGRR